MPGPTPGLAPAVLRRGAPARFREVTEDKSHGDTAEWGQMNNDVIQLRSVSRRYGSGDGAVTALDEVSLSFPRGTFTAVMGPSGSGKSTLLQCAAGWTAPRRVRSPWPGPS
ncbi:hypothetical protein SVIO_021220 [Streptomyces violaceusniger]|uniref:ABC transporter domain-containing protein n=1 Tax=Streptomyces violaceusniger TaxID=68280 RepID=A0A4D4L0C9_STRVO|nr:hypothetical protein SVIO_021220 [Streptomyces violaceusniger]